MIRSGSRVGVRVKYGQASVHKEGGTSRLSVCGIPLKPIYAMAPWQWDRRCPRCFADYSKERFLEEIEEDNDGRYNRQLS